MKTIFNTWQLYSSLIKKSTCIVRIMKNYDEFPPLNLFKKVLQISPSSAYLYASIWACKPSSHHLSIRIKDVKPHFLISPTLFRNHLLALARLNLLSFDETVEFFTIKFAIKDEWNAGVYLYPMPTQDRRLWRIMFRISTQSLQECLSGKSHYLSWVS